MFPEAEGLTDEQMMKIAREMNLSETVFVLNPEKSKQQTVNSEQPVANGEHQATEGKGQAADGQRQVERGQQTDANNDSASTTKTQSPTDANPQSEIPDPNFPLRRLRIFTPMREIPFAGHPVVGTWNALAREGVVAPPEGGNGWTRIHHEVGIGILPVDIEFKDGEPSQVFMTQGKFEILAEVEDAHEQEELARALGRAREDLDETLPLQVISTGLTALAIPIRSLADLSRCRINTSLLSEIYTRLGATGCHVFTRETIEIGDARAHARFFAPADNIPEDPATGSACGALAGYLVHHGASERGVASRASISS